jgi:hypothetical protein
MNRNISVGSVISEVFEIYRDQAAVLLPAALLVFAIEGLLSGVLVAINPILIIVAVIAQLVATYLYQGMVVELVADVQDGRRDASVGDLFRSVTPVLLPLIAVGILAGLGIAIGFVLLIVPGLFLLTIWSVVSPVIVLERPGVLPAFGRSHNLVRENGWQVLGVIAVFFLILLVVNAALSAVGNAIGPAGSVVADVIASVIAAPLLALAGAALYFNLRRVKGELGPAGGARGGTASMGQGAGAPAGTGAAPDSAGGAVGEPAPPGGATGAPPRGGSVPPPGGSPGPGGDPPARSQP